MAITRQPAESPEDKEECAYKIAILHAQWSSRFFLH
jgi:hypothetical protein